MNEDKAVTQTEISDPLYMLSSSGDGGSEPSVSSSSFSGDVNNRKQKDDVRVDTAMSHDRHNIITNKDLRNLKRNKYEKIRANFSESYVIKNKKTGQIVEIKAANSYHACTLIGWRPQNCKVIDVIKSEETPTTNENNTVMEVSNEKEAQKEDTNAAPDGVATGAGQV